MDTVASYWWIYVASMVLFYITSAIIMDNRMRKVMNGDIHSIRRGTILMMVCVMGGLISSGLVVISIIIKLILFIKHG